MELENCDLDNFHEQNSSITNKTIITNLNTSKFLISPLLNSNNCSIAITDWQRKIKFYEVGSCRSKLNSFFNRVIDLQNTPNREIFARHLNDILMDYKKDILANNLGYFSHLNFLLLRLWSLDCIAWPKQNNQNIGRVKKTIDTIGWGDKHLLITTCLSKLPIDLKKHSPNLLIVLILTLNNISEEGDISPETINLQGFFPYTYWTYFAKYWSSVLNHKYSLPKLFTYYDFGSAGKYHSAKSEIDFKWVIEKDPNMDTWAKNASDFVQFHGEGKKHWVWAINTLFSFLLKTHGTTRNPKEYLLKNYPNNLRLNEKYCTQHEFTRETIFNRLSYFMEYLLSIYGTYIDSNGNSCSIPEMYNPHPHRRIHSTTHIETSRKIMPTRLIREALQIITENIVRDENGNPVYDEGGHILHSDFAWAKSAFRQNQHGTDYFKYFHPITEKCEVIWSPVRAIVVILKLLLPVRTKQILCQESNECDSEIPTQNGWVKNNHILVNEIPNNKIIERGALHKFQRKDGSYGIHIYFNTNKTCEITKNKNRSGYIMPWEKKDAIDMYLFIQDWQMRYNPVIKKTKWSEINNFRLYQSQSFLEQMGSGTFLFRDPTRGDGGPITYNKVRKLWLVLLEEVEKRLFASGERYPDGSPIKLVLSRTKSGQVSSVAYDLHSLRVTGISLLYEEGVPIELIMKIVGHATILMTLYYTKIDAEDISKKCDIAIEKISSSEKEKTQWISFLKNITKEKAFSTAAFGNYEAYEHLIRNPLPSFTFMPHGICPVGKSKCHIGLINKHSDNNSSRYGPIPGLSRNCTRCRFFITGGLFFDGLTTHLNEKSYILSEESKNYEQAQTELDEIENIIARMRDAKEIVPDNYLAKRAISLRKYDDCLVNIDEAARNFTAALNIHSQVEYILHNCNKSNSTEYSLLTLSSMEQICSEFKDISQFEQLNYLCKNAEIYEGLQIEWQKPNLQRLRLINRILLQNGFNRTLDFITDEKTCLRIGNEICSFLKTKIGYDNINRIIDGKTTMKELGIYIDFDNLIKSFLYKNVLPVNQKKLPHSTPKNIPEES